jgi:endoglucanase
MNCRLILQKVLLAVLITLTTIRVFAQSLSYDIRVNQVGYLPNSIKMAAITNSMADSFRVMTGNVDSLVFQGQLLPSAYYTSSGENVKIADFTLLKSSGRYVIVVNDLGKSLPFSIQEDVFTELSKASIKAYYFNRASIAILSEYAGKYARAMGHPDTAVVVLPSAASVNRPAGTIISTPGGWYDAGDYNKYIVSSGISVFTLLSAYETYPEFYDTLNLNIPESNNNIPDILDEALWNIKWMSTMQDTDGGVYHKTTEAQFSGFLMPSMVTSTRYVTAKSTSATLDFAAIMAMTARIYKRYDTELAIKAIKQAEKAWQWAMKHPNVVFKNPPASGIYPSVGTGGYEDSGFDDEFSWCAAELFITTKDTNYYKLIGLDKTFGMPGWPIVNTLGLLSLLVNQDSLASIANIEFIKSKLLDFVSGTKNNLIISPYRIPGDFYYWAGNNAFANWGMLFMQAYHLTHNASYYNAAVSTLDYLLGKNATSYCFVTGQGTKSPMHIHHRISSADGVAEPVPGLLVCGADPGDVSDCGSSSYPSTFPAKSYLDSECSYSTNEVAIGINAPFAFLAGAIQCEYKRNFIDSMPRYFSISKNRINLPYKIGDDIQVTIEGNSDWRLNPVEDWISISSTEGSGNATVQINSQSDNPTDSSRIGKIYIYCQGTITDSIIIAQNGVRKSFKLEFEDYTSMSGIQVESTSDIGGGKNLGYVDPNDWVTYNLDITIAGIYDVVIRHAGYAGNFDMILNGTLLKKVTFPKTADWQVWDSYSTQLPLSEGQHELKILFNAAGVNLNWMQFDWNSPLNVLSLNYDDIDIYPVPADKLLTIRLNTTGSIKDIEILSLDGKVMHKTAVEKNMNTIIDVSMLKPGMYILRAKTGSAISNYKIIIR